MGMSSEAAVARTRKPRGQGASRRGEILDAAKQLFLEEGYQHATMRRIAAAVGVSPTALYLHFADKESILTAIAEDFFGELLVLLEDAHASDAAPLIRCRAGMRAYIELGLDRPDEYRLTFQPRVAQPGHERPIPAPANQSFEILATEVGRLIADGIYKPADPCLAAEAIWCALHGATSILIDMPGKLRSGRDELVDALLDMIQAGMMAPAQKIM